MENKRLHWAYGVAENIKHKRGEKEKITIASGITPSGTIHVGNFREVITQDIIKRALEKSGKKVRFIYSWDDFDVFRKVPKNMPDQEKLKKFLRKPIVDTPDTFDCGHDSFADHNIEEFQKDLPKVDINPEFIRQSLKYTNCDYAEGIKKALENTDKIKKILDQYRKEPLDEAWSPASIFCEKCGKDTISKIEYKGDYDVYYVCECGHSDTFDIRKKGIIKLKWRIDWPMRWNYEQVDCEPAGKDHFAAGGTRISGEQIIKDIYNDTPPYGFMYEWISIKGGKQFSSSEGNVTTLAAVLEIYEPSLLRYIFASTRPNAEFSISFDLDVFKIYEDFDRCERIYFGEEANEKEIQKQKEIYELSFVGNIPSELPFQPSFRHLTNILLINELDIEKSLNYLNKDIKNDYDKERLRTRLLCAKNWVEKYAPDDFKYSVQEDVPESIDLGKEMKEILRQIPEILSKKKFEDPQELHEKFYNLTQEKGVKPKDFFQACYKVLIGKEKGPKLASFILEIGQDKIEKLFRKV